MRTAEDLATEVETLRQQMRDINLKFSQLKAVVRDQSNLSSTVYNASYVRGAADAAAAIDKVLWS